MRIKAMRFAEKLFLRWLPLAVILTFILVPLLWVISLSFKHSSDIVSEGFTLFPNPFTFYNYVSVWSDRMGGYFVNSLAMTCGAVSVIGVLVFLNGYALSRFNFKFKTGFMLIMLMTQMIPRIIIISPLYILIRDMNLVDHYLGVVLVEIASALPFNTLLMKGFISAVPKEIDEASKIDGCNTLQTMLHVIIPIVIPGIVTVLAFAFINCWNEYLLPYTLLSSGKKFPISVGLRFMITQTTINYGGLAAGAIIALLPPLLLFGYVQRYLVAGMGAGALKG